MTLQAVAVFSNRESLCIGEITTKEAESAMNDDPAFDGYGLYLVSVKTENPSAPGTILAKFLSEDAARKLAQFFRAHGHLEPVDALRR
jgi:hypothetical protein